LGREIRHKRNAANGQGRSNPIGGVKKRGERKRHSQRRKEGEGKTREVNQHSSVISIILTGSWSKWEVLLKDGKNAKRRLLTGDLLDCGKANC